MSPAEKMWWIKVVASVAIALATLGFQLYFDMSGVTSIMLGVIIYLVLSDLLSNRLHVERFRSLKIGVGAYFFTWLTTWILLYTFFRSIA